MVLEQQVTLITGASRGFGLAAAEELIDRGHLVIATMRNPDRDRNNLSNLDPAAYEIAQCDVTDPASIEGAVSAGLKRFGRVDALFNNAGTDSTARSRTCPTTKSRARWTPTSSARSAWPEPSCPRCETNITARSSTSHHLPDVSSRR